MDNKLWTAVLGVCYVFYKIDRIGNFNRLTGHWFMHMDRVDSHQEGSAYVLNTLGYIRLSLNCLCLRWLRDYDHV